MLQESYSSAEVLAVNDILLYSGDLINSVDIQELKSCFFIDLDSVLREFTLGFGPAWTWPVFLRAPKFDLKPNV